MTYSAFFQCVVLFVASLFVSLTMSASVENVGNDPREILGGRVQPYQSSMTAEREVMNRVLSRILDMTYDLYKELGASHEDLKALHHKRGVIQACYFQAISCY